MSSPLRNYSRAVRLLAAIVAILLFLPAGIIVTVILFQFPDMRTLSTVFGLVGAWGGMFVLLKIAATGSSTAFLEQRIGAGDDEQAFMSDSDS